MRQQKFILLAILMAFCVVTNAQETTNTPETSTPSPTTVTTPTTEKTKEKPNIWFGPKFGMDIAHFSTNGNDLKKDLAKNYQFGILCQMGKVLYVQPELYYASYKTPLTLTDDSTRTNFIKVPIMLGWRIFDIGLFGLHVKAGPQFSFLLNNKDTFSGSKKLTWQVGAGIDLFQFITTDLRYTLVPGKSISEQIDNFDPNSTGLNFTVGLKIR